MKKLCFLLSCAVLFMNLGGCAVFRHAGQTRAKTINSLANSFPHYSGPRARLAVADFDVQTAKADFKIGSGLREMLITALVNSNRFSVVERQALNTPAKEQEPVNSTVSRVAQGAQASKLKTADLIIAAAVNEFEPEASGGKAGIGGGGGMASGLLGGLLGTSLNKAHIALDIRIVDASTSEVLAATRIQGQATDVSGGFMNGFLGSWALGAGLSGYAHTPMEKAVRLCVIEAVRYIAQALPQEYYKY